MEKTIEAERFKQVRESLNFTQSEFAEVLGIKNSTADIERSRTRITGAVVMELLQRYQINPLWLYGKSQKRLLNPNEVETSPKAIVVDAEGNENILMVHAKAAAGYGANLGDPEYFRQLPAFNFPLPEYRNSSFRGFQISGDSMMPLVYHGDWVLAKAVNRFSDVRDGGVYIIVEPDSIRLKKIKLNGQKGLRLVSYNPDYPPVDIDTRQVLEIWEYHSRISFGVDKIQGLTLERVYEEVKEIKNQLNQRSFS